MKKNLIMFLILLFFVPVFGQKNKKDIVYLKTGGIIKGQLITSDAEKIKINSAGNEWVFKASEVDSISSYSNTINEAGLSQNYFFDTSLGVLVGNSGNSQTAPFSFLASVNLKTYKNWYAGAGLGAEFLDETYMPAFAQIQYKFRNTRFTPFINMQFGYMIPLEDGAAQPYYGYYPNYSSYYPGPQNSSELNTKGGFMINPSFGFQRYASENFGWFFSFGYRYHQLNYSGTDNYQLESNFSRLSLKIGIIFN